MPRNAFILYMPPGNHEAMVHYQDTIQNRVELSRILPHIDVRTAANLQGVFGNRRVAVWGSRDVPQNHQKFDRMEVGDDLLIVEGSMIKLLGKCAAKIVSPALSRELWQNLRGGETDGWNLIYFIANPLEIGIPWAEFTSLLEYPQPFQLRGFTMVSPARMVEFYSRHDDLYSALVRIRDGAPVEETSPRIAAAADLAAPQDEEFAPPPGGASDHLRMQWILSRLGRKAGARVWVPMGDQGRVTRAFQFSDFEPNFAAGVDIPSPYVENIDVVWKEEFRLDAAFEIENSTSIYSGLLRFSDLISIAPNTSYPLFIVAPRERKGRVAEHTRRPTFQRIRLSERVRFLPYEAVDEVDTFFAPMDSGLNVDLMRQKSESLS